MRSFNYTGRKRISQESVLLGIYTTNAERNVLTVELDLEGYDFPPESRIAIEAYYQVKWKRFDFGTVGRQIQPEDVFLDEFEDIEDIHFRVKVIDVLGEKILGMADRVKPVSSDILEASSVGIFPVKNGDLYGSIWKVDYTDERPILIIDSKAGNKNTIFNDIDFVSLVLPAAFRDVLVRILLYEKSYDLSDEEDWRVQWRLFCLGLGIEDFPEEESEIDEKYEWIDIVVSKFCRKHRLLLKYSNNREESES